MCLSCHAHRIIVDSPDCLSACLSACLLVSLLPPQRNGASVVKELLSDAGRRSCLKAPNRDGATPLHLAVQAGLLDIAQLLVNAGAKVDATDRVSDV